jgi:hypothetical protein
MTMSLNELETQALGSIADGLAGADPRLASMLTIFSRLAAGEEMPAGEKIRVRRGRPAAHRPRRARRHPRRGIAFPHARRLYARLGWPQAMLVLWAVIAAALLTAALVLTASGPETCVRSMGTACPSPSITRMPARANADAPRAVSMSRERQKEQAVADAGPSYDGDGGQRRPDDHARSAGQVHPAGHGCARRVREYRKSRGDRAGNAIFSVLARAGVGPAHLLTTRGRMTGRLRTTPVILAVRGQQRWLVAPYGAVPWVLNARAAVTNSHGYSPSLSLSRQYP